MLLPLSQGKIEILPISLVSEFSSIRQYLILPNAMATHIVAATPINFTSLVEVDITQLIQQAVGYYQNGNAIAHPQLRHSH